MLAINHALTGAAIGLAVGRPLVAIPAALTSHFVCDALPHFGAGKEFVATKAFRILLVTDAAACVALVGVLAAMRPAHWLLASVCAFVATTPDLWSIREFIRAKQGKPYVYGRIKSYLNGIQWFERPIGVVVDATWAVAATLLLFVIL